MAGLLKLLCEESEIENKPEDHGYTIGDPLDVKVTDLGVQLTTDPEV